MPRLKSVPSIDPPPSMRLSDGTELAPVAKAMMNDGDLARRADRAIADRRVDLLRLSQTPCGTMEIELEERSASSAIAELLASSGAHVVRPYGGLETALRAEATGRPGGPTVAVVLEYDALPGLGHGCGHNLMAMIGTATFLGVAAVIDELQGRVVAIGAPAEESGGGKIALIKSGAFDDVDAAVMVHVFNQHELAPRTLAMDVLEVEFHGVAAHAASAPEEGRNALDAVIATFNGITALRLQARPDARLHGTD